MYKKTVFALFIMLGLYTKGQQAVAYNKDFHFKEGIYLTFDQFRDNKPIEKEIIVAPGNKEALNYIEEALNEKTIKFKTSSGNDSTLNVSSLWGYCQNNAIYVNTHEQSSRITVIGTICHFTATIITYSQNFNPMYYSSISIPIKEIRQFMLDTENGQVVEYTLDQLELIFQRDAKLFNEFNELKRKQKREMMFVYLRKYNELHPLYFPID